MLYPQSIMKRKVYSQGLVKYVREKLLRYYIKADCPCNLVDFLCDEFCCCDSLCSTYSDLWDKRRKCTERSINNISL